MKSERVARACSISDGISGDEYESVSRRRVVYRPRVGAYVRAYVFT